MAKKAKTIKYGVIKNAAEAADWGDKYVDCKILCTEADHQMKVVSDALMEYHTLTGDNSFGKAKVCVRKSMELKGEGVGKELKDKVKLFVDALPDALKKTAADLKLAYENMSDPRVVAALELAGLELVEKQSKFIGSV